MSVAPGGTTSIIILIQNLLKQNGIEFEPTPVDSVAWLGLWYSRSFPDQILSYWATNDPTLNFFGQNKFYSKAPQNTAFINDPQVDDVVQKIKTTSDPAKLREHARFLWDYDTLGAWNVWIGWEPSFTITNPRLHNFMSRNFFVFQGLRQFVWLSDAPRTTP